MRYKNQNVAVLGAGLSGTAAALLLKAEGANVHRLTPKLDARTVELLGKEKFCFALRKDALFVTAGEAGLRDLADGFGSLGRAARAMREANGRRFLVINASASFAATWLVGRIGKFKGLHPEIDVLLDANPIEDTLERANVDALVRWGAGDFPGLATTLLFKEDVFPVCAPSLARGPHPLEAPQDLRHHTLLHLDWNPSFSTWPDWADWLKAAGAPEIDTSRGVWFNHMSMAIHAAARGQGVALSSTAIAADELASGRLVAPFTMQVHTPFGYYFLSRPAQADSPRIKALREFLVAEAAASMG